MPFPGFAVIRDSARWTTLWNRFEHYGYRDGAAVRAPVPTIDFKREILLAAALGSMSGCSNEHHWIRRVQEFRDSIVVHLGFNPADNTPCQMVIQPIDVVRVPRTSKLVSFRGERSIRSPPGPAPWWDRPSWGRFDAFPDWKQQALLLAFAKDPATSKADLIEVIRRAEPEWTIHRVLMDRPEVRSSPKALSMMASRFGRQDDEVQKLLMTQFGSQLAHDDQTSPEVLRLLIEELPKNPAYVETARHLIQNPVVLGDQELLSWMTRNTQHFPDVHRKACSTYLGRWPAWKRTGGGSWTAWVVCDNLPAPDRSTN